MIRARHLLAAPLAALLVAAPARAATFTVTGTSDAGSCEGTVCPSIRAALGSAGSSPGADTIVVPSGDYQLTLGPLAVDSDVAILGAGARTTTVRGTRESRVFEVARGSVASISRLTMAGGTATPGNGFFGGDLVNDGALVLDRVRVTGDRHTAAEASPTAAAR